MNAPQTAEIAVPSMKELLSLLNRLIDHGGSVGSGKTQGY